MHVCWSTGAIVCVAVYMHICVHACGRQSMTLGIISRKLSSLFFSDRVSHCLENSVHRLTWLTRETRGSTYSHLSSAGITSVCHQARGCLFVCFCFSLMWVLKIKLRYSFYLCMYVFICMHMWIWHLCTCVQLLKPEHTQSPEEDVRCPALSELSWWPASPSNPLSLHPTQCWGYRHVRLVLTLYIDAGDLNSGLLDWSASTLSHGAIFPAPYPSSYKARMSFTSQESSLFHSFGQSPAGIPKSTENELSRAGVSGVMRPSQSSSVLPAVSIPPFLFAFSGSTFVGKLKGDEVHSWVLSKPMKVVSIVPTNGSSDVNFKSVMMIIRAVLY